MTQEQLAMLVGVSRQSVAKWEAGKASPDMDNLLKLCDIFNVSLDDLVVGDVSEREPTPTAKIAEDVAHEQICDVVGYDEHMKRFAMLISFGASSVLFGLAAAYVGLYIAVTEEFFSPWALIPFFVGIIACMNLLIIAGLEHSSFRRAHPYIENFYTEEDRLRTNRLFANNMCIGVGLCLLGIICLANFSYLNETGLMALFLLCLGVGLERILWAALMYARLNLASYNREAELKDANVVLFGKSLHYEGIPSLIMGIATIIAFIKLFMQPSFIPGPFFIYWIIGGILAGIIEAFVKGDKS